jgi:beta-lactamase superfamily II metal-dependent hydrolase
MTNGYKIEHLICSPYERRIGDNSVELDEWNEFATFVAYFKKNGTKVYRPFRQDSFAKPWWTPCGLKFWLLGPVPHIATSDTRELHDACLVIRADLGKRRCTFTGDSSDTSLAHIAASTTHICDDILHVSHHGSINGADLSFIKKANISYSVISTELGIYDNIPHPTALKRYEENTKHNVYRTDKGSVTWTF